MLVQVLLIIGAFALPLPLLLCVLSLDFAERTVWLLIGNSFLFPNFATEMLAATRSPPSPFLLLLAMRKYCTGRGCASNPNTARVSFLCGRPADGRQ